MHSRLYRNVLNSYFWMQNCVAFSNLYNDTGILGIMASANSQYAGQSVDVICKEMLVSTVLCISRISPAHLAQETKLYQQDV